MKGRTMTTDIERVSFNLPVDIIFEVLSRLPVKTLIRFKSVCKTWYALIEDPSFVKTHKKEHSKELEPTYNNMIVTANGPGSTKRFSFLHFSDDSHKLTDTEFFFLPFVEDCVVVVGVCSGLVCLSSSFDSPELIICNPTTRQFRKTPKCRFMNAERDLIFLGFCLHVNGFEIIRIIYSQTNLTYEIPVIRAELYTMCTDTWREIDVKLNESDCLGVLGRCGLDYPESVVVDGVFYRKAECNYGKPYVAYFDKCKNVFDVILGVPMDAYISTFWCLLEINGELAMATYYFCNKFDLWVPNEDRYWTQIHEIDFLTIPSYPYNIQRKIRVFGSSRNGELVLVTHFEDNVKLFSCNLNTRESKCLHEVDAKERIDNVYLYTESLTSVS